MRTTGYSLSITGQMQANGELPAGVYTPDECIPAAKYIAELARRGVMIKEIYL
jgi:lysine 6-dehydrogenase